jgi:hypothetical protein
LIDDGSHGGGPVNLGRAGRRKQQMRVAIDKSGQHDAAGGVDFGCVTGVRQVLYAAAGTDLFDDAVAN